MRLCLWLVTVHTITVASVIERDNDNWKAPTTSNFFNIQIGFQGYGPGYRLFQNGQKDICGPCLPELAFSHVLEQGACEPLPGSMRTYEECKNLEKQKPVSENNYNAAFNFYGYERGYRQSQNGNADTCENESKELDSWFIEDYTDCETIVKGSAHGSGNPLNMLSFLSMTGSVFLIYSKFI